MKRAISAPAEIRFIGVRFRKVRKKPPDSVTVTKGGAEGRGDGAGPRLSLAHTAVKRIEALMRDWREFMSGGLGGLCKREEGEGEGTGHFIKP